MFLGDKHYSKMVDGSPSKATHKHNALGSSLIQYGSSMELENVP